MNNSALILVTPYLYATLLSLIISAVIIVSLKQVHKEAYKTRTMMLGVPLLGSVAIMVWVSSLCLIHRLFLHYPNPRHMICNQISSASVQLICTSLVTLAFASFGSAVVLGVINYHLGDKIAIHLFHAKPFNQSDSKEIYETLTDLSEKGGVKPPKLYLIERSKPIIFAVGKRNAPTIMVSVGLLETLSSKELRASLAHEISHIRNNDGLIRTLVTSLKFAAPFVFPSYLIEPAICREREFLADEGSVTLTSEPSALISALIKISEACDVVAKGGFFCGFAMSFFHYSPARGGIFSKHPPLEERLNRLLKLEKACRIRKSNC